MKLLGRNTYWFQIITKIRRVEIDPAIGIPLTPSSSVPHKVEQPDLQWELFMTLIQWVSRGIVLLNKSKLFGFPVTAILVSWIFCFALLLQMLFCFSRIAFRN